jgi:ribonuclease T2
MSPGKDACDGTYSQFCDPSRETYNISCIISSYGDNDLLNYMNTYWLDQKGDNENFWEHEWNKHGRRKTSHHLLTIHHDTDRKISTGTCYSTLNPSCFPNYTQQEEVVAFFQQAVNQFKAIDTYSVRSSSPFQYSRSSQL